MKVPSRSALVLWKRKKLNPLFMFSVRWPEVKITHRKLGLVINCIGLNWSMNICIRTSSLLNECVLLLYMYGWWGAKMWGIASYRYKNTQPPVKYRHWIIVSDQRSLLVCIWAGIHKSMCGVVFTTGSSLWTVYLFLAVSL